MDPLSLSMLIGGAGSLISGIFGSSAADKAAKAQTAAANKALALVVKDENGVVLMKTGP